MRQDRVVSRPREIIQTRSSIKETHGHRQDIIIIDPVEMAVAPSQRLQPRRLVIPDDDDNEERRTPGILFQPNGRGTGNRVENAILIDDSSDVVMVDAIDIVEGYPSFSRESSCTLSAESLPSLFEMEIDNDNAERGPHAREFLETQRDQVRRAHRRALFC